MYVHTIQELTKWDTCKINQCVHNRFAKCQDLIHCSSECTVNRLSNSLNMSSTNKFRPTALSSCISKLLNKITATRIESFLLASGVIYPSVQKNFLPKSNSFAECKLCNHALDTILHESCELRLPLPITFCVYKHAFGSVDSVPHAQSLTCAGLLESVREALAQYIQH